MVEEQRERGLKLRVGVFVLVGLVAILGMVYLLGARARLFEARFTLHAEFTEVGGLAEGATVRLAGVQIGRVVDVHLPSQPGGKVRVDMSIARKYGDRIRKDSVARIETQGLLGDKIVEITVGTAKMPAVAANETIGSRDPFDIGQVMNESAQIVRSVGELADSLRETAETLNQSGIIDEAAATVASARKITTDVSRIVGEIEKGKGWAHALIYEEPVALRQVNELIASTQRILDRVDRGEGTVGVLTSAESTAAAKRLVAAMNRLGEMMDRPAGDDGLLPGLLFDPKYKSVLDDLRVVAHNFRDVSDRLAGGKGMLGGLIKDEPADGSIRQASSDLQAALANLREITAKINDGEGTVGALIADPTVYERLVSILDGASRSFLLRGLMRGLGSGRNSKDAPSADTGKSKDAPTAEPKDKDK
ncbi:MAG TPA: MlaD family protein [Methylomirabilota bacterium]|nr:MlaD family protein [Methylomirabilota bacterium]HEV8615724.1 MlaD family protein [Methylomirabilota bacterium]